MRLRNRSRLSLAAALPAVSLSFACSSDRVQGFPQFEDTADSVPACTECEARLFELYGEGASYGAHWGPGSTGALPPGGDAYRPEEFTGIHTVTGLAFDDWGRLYATAVVDPEQNRGGSGLVLHFDADYAVEAEVVSDAHLWDVTSNGKRVFVGGQRTGPSGMLYAKDATAVGYEFDTETGDLRSVVGADGAAIKTLEVVDDELHWGGWAWSGAADAFSPATGVVELRDLGGGLSAGGGGGDLLEGEVLDRATDEYGRIHEIGWATRSGSSPDNPGLWLTLLRHGALAADGGDGGPGVAVVPIDGGFTLVRSPTDAGPDSVSAPFEFSAYLDDTDEHVGVGGFGGPDLPQVVARAAARADERRAYLAVRIGDAIEVWDVSPAQLEINRRIAIPRDDVDVFSLAVAPDNAIVLGGRRTDTDTPWIARFTMNELVTIR